MTLTSLNTSLNKQVDALSAKLSDAYTDLSDAVDTFNATMEEAWQEVRYKMDLYNSVIGEANALISDVHSEIESIEADDDEDADTMSAWADNWDIILEEIELENPGELSMRYAEDGSDTLSSLPTESD